MQPSRNSLPPADRIYQIVLSSDQLDIVANALGDRPYRQVVHLIGHIQQQIAAIDAEHKEASQ